MNLVRLTALHLLACVTMLAAELPERVGFLDVFVDVDFEHPLWVAPFPDRPKEFLVLEQAGTAVRVTARGAEAKPFADLFALVQMPKKGYTEEGLLSLAFHPGWATNRLVFTWSTTHRAGRLQTILVRWKADAAGTALDPASETVLLTVDQPFTNHNGGDLHFGRDGMLYLSVGDGGSAGDPHGNGQNLGVLLGKILRLDVDHDDHGQHYRIPADNPFVGQAGARGEIWAYGLRNVWRMSFDPATGDLWAGDVGQNAREEIDLIVKGGNYGWKAREGFLSFKNGEKLPGMIDPIHDYDRDAGRSVTGGFVYRGSAIPALVGAYVFGDYATRRIWALRPNPQGRPLVKELARAPQGISSFGVDADGELLMTCFNGKVYRLVP